MYKTIVILVYKGLELNVIVITACLWFIRINVLLGCQYVFCDQKQFHCKNAFYYLKSTQVNSQNLSPWSLKTAQFFTVIIVTML